MPLRPPNEDLFESTRMSFGEHLEELRKVLVRALYGLALGVVIGMVFADEVVSFLKTPLTRAIVDFHIQQAQEQLKSEYGGLVPLEYQVLFDNQLLAPRTVRIDPDQLDRRNHPAPEGTSLRFPDARFAAQSLAAHQVSAVCKKLVQAESSNGSVSYLDNAQSSQAVEVWSALGPEKQERIRKWSQAASLSSAEIEEFANLLNELAETADFSNHPAFAQRFSGESQPGLFTLTEAVTLAETKKRMSQSSSSAESTALRMRTNQWLIWSALAPDLPRPDLPLMEVVIWESADVNVQSLAATEAFMIWMKAGVVLGFVIASPWIFYQLWLFISAGLYPHEQKYVYLYLPISLGLFFAGAALAFFFVFDPVLKFLFQFNANMGIDPQPRIGDWMSFVLLLPLGFGIAFQLPIVMLFLYRMGIFSIANYLEKWRIAVMVIFIISMVLTPAEPISMILMAIPLTLLYFFGIALCKWLPANRNPYRQVYEP